MRGGRTAARDGRAAPPSWAGTTRGNSGSAAGPAARACAGPAAALLSCPGQQTRRGDWRSAEVATLELLQGGSAQPDVAGVALKLGEHRGPPDLRRDLDAVFVVADTRFAAAVRGPVATGEGQRAVPGAPCLCSSRRTLSRPSNRMMAASLPRRWRSPRSQASRSWLAPEVGGGGLVNGWRALLLRCGAPWQHHRVASIRPRHPPCQRVEPRSGRGRAGQLPKTRTDLGELRLGDHQEFSAWWTGFRFEL